MYRALLEATAFGAKRVVQAYREGGVPVDEILICGGAAEKNPLMMQIYADVLDMPLKVSRCLKPLPWARPFTRRRRERRRVTAERWRPPTPWDIPNTPYTARIRPIGASTRRCTRITRRSTIISAKGATR